MKKYDYLIVGAGLFGAVCAWQSISITIWMMLLRLH